MSSRPRKHLDALGIDTWVRRDARVAAVAPPEPSAPRVAEPPVRAAPPVMAPPPRTVSAPSQAVIVPAITPAAIEVPADWDALRAMVSTCQRCKLCRTRTQTVFGVGPVTAPLMVVGEGPGADEDAQGEPFVGRAGKLLDEMLRSIGRTRAENTYIANVVKCRPPGNRDPEAEEVEGCRPYLDMQIQLLKPRLMGPITAVAARIQAVLAGSAVGGALGPSSGATTRLTSSVATSWWWRRNWVSVSIHSSFSSVRPLVIAAR